MFLDDYRTPNEQLYGYSFLDAAESECESRIV